jgi:hypothetical protein
VSYNRSVVIRRSAAGEVRQLVERLTGDDPVRREAAVARLAVIGPRAVATRARALEGPLPAPAARLVDAAEIEVASAAVAVLRGFLRATAGALASASFERLTGVTLDPTRPEPVRTAALEALSDLPPATTAQVIRELENDPSRNLANLARHPADGPALPSRLAEITQAAECPDPADLRPMLAAQGASAPLPALRRLVDLLRERETAETATSRRTEWQGARAAVHQALATRGSRLALYDLRETLPAVPGPLPVGFVAALEAVGDASCLPDLAAAYVRARQARDDWWTEHLARTFRTIVARERLTRRSAAIRQVASKWPQAAEELMPGRR